MSPGLSSTATDRTPAMSFFRAMPWYDAAGRFSLLKLVVLLALLVPAGLVAYRYFGGMLGARPINEAVHQIGNWAIRLIVVSLAITPASRLLKFPSLMGLRRLIGVTAFCYVAAHLMLYIAGEAFDLAKVATEIAFRIYLTIGFVALLILAAMAATSTDGMVKRLGGKRWRRLHQMVYVAGLLAAIHFFLQTKANIDEPLVIAGIFFWLMGYRALVRVKTLRKWWPAVLAIIAAIGTAAGEALYYSLKVGAPLARVLEANLGFALGPRPAVTVLAICLGLALAGAAREIQAGFSKSSLRRA